MRCYCFFLSLPQQPINKLCILYLQKISKIQLGLVYSVLVQHVLDMHEVLGLNPSTHREKKTQTPTTSFLSPFCRATLVQATIISQLGLRQWLLDCSLLTTTPLDHSQ